MKKRKNKTNKLSTSINVLSCNEVLAECFFVKILGHSNRNELWTNYKKFVNCLKKEIFTEHFVIWIFGSFVRNQSPCDIDIVIGVTANDKLRIDNNQDIVDFIYSLASAEYNIHVQHIMTLPSKEDLFEDAPEWLEPILQGRDGKQDIIQIEYLKHKRLNKNSIKPNQS